MLEFPAMSEPVTRIADNPDWLGQLAGQTALLEGEGLEAAGTVEVSWTVSASGQRAGGVIVHCDEECGFSGDTLAVMVSVFTPTALFRLTGSARAEGKELYCAPEMRIERIERRRWPRARLDLPVTLCPLHGSDIDSVPGRTVDISVGGACVETLSPVDSRRSDDVKVVIRLADGADIECSCSTIAVEETEDGWRYRLSFRDLDETGTSRLQELTAA
jgi:hypothetical protein